MLITEKQLDLDLVLVVTVWTSNPDVTKDIVYRTKMCGGSVSPQGLTIAAGFHDGRVGEREDDEQDGLGERGHVEIRQQREGSRHTRQQGVCHVGTRRGDGRFIGGLVQGAAVVGAKRPPGNTGHLRTTV